MSRAPSVCIEPGCGELTDRGRCADCEEENQKRRARRSPPREDHISRRSDWQKTRAAQLKREPQCRRCNAPATHVHHIRDRDFGGTDDPSNLESLCASCHNKHTAATKPAGFRAFR